MQNPVQQFQTVRSRCGAGICFSCKTARIVYAFHIFQPVYRIRFSFTAFRTVIHFPALHCPEESSGILCFYLRIFSV